MDDQNNYYSCEQPQPQPQPVKEEKNGVAVASMVCGIISFFCCNPLYLVSLAAIVLGIVGMLGNKPKKGIATAGLILGIASIMFGVIVDIILLPLTFGTSFLF